MAVLAKLQDQEVVLVDDLAFDAPKTKEMAGVLKALNLHDTTCLVGTAGLQPAVYKSARNIRGVEILPGRFLDFLDPWGNHVQVVQYDEVQFSKAPFVLKGMGLDELGKTEAALRELREKGLA